MLSPRGACLARTEVVRGRVSGGTALVTVTQTRAHKTDNTRGTRTHAVESREKEKHVQTTTTNCLTCQWHDHETRESAESPLYTTRYSGQPCGSLQLSLIYATGALSGKSGLPVSDSWMTMPTMPIMAARPLLRSAFSLNSLTLGSE